LEPDVQVEYKKARENYYQWYVAKTEQEGIDRLVELEADLQNFLRWIGDRYRDVFERRRMGQDYS
jgi:hypothetical protein